MHPADIAKELKQYSFFSSFNDTLLLQVSAMVRAQHFRAGDCILQEGQDNKNLYFLRQGTIEVHLLGEVIATIDQVGQALGEMSVITSRPAATALKAVTNVDCFVINSDDFVYVHPRDKDRLNALLYHIYSVILAERLVKTNEKARLFEILNRELHEAQSLIGKTGGKVLLLEPEKKNQMPVRVALGGSGVHLDITDTIEAAKDFLRDGKYDVVISDEKDVALLREAQVLNLAKFAVLLTGCDVQGNLDVLDKNRFVNYIVSRNTEDRNITIRYILTALSKLLNNDIFGIEKYLMWGVEVQAKRVTHSSQRTELRDELKEHFKKSGIRSSVLDRVNTATEEMLMNAIYDAPVDSHGQSLYNHISRKDEVRLDTHQQSSLTYACDGTLLAVAVTDPFGSLSKDVLIDYLLTCYRGQAGSLNASKGGAGRGLHQIVEASDLTIFNVKKSIRTEVICLFYVDGQKREMHPTFHYFFT